MNITRLNALISGIIFLLSCGVARSNDHLNIIGDVPSNVEIYQPLEVNLEYEGAFIDPYDPKEIRLDASIILPSGDSIVYPGFFNGHLSENISKWGLRYTPQKTGVYSIRLMLTGNKEVLKTKAFKVEVKPGQGNGFLHLKSPESVYTFQFDSGKPFRGIGMNFGWEDRSNGPKSSLYTYDAFLKPIHDAGINFFRTWMCPWNLPLEWKQVDKGRYKDETRYRYNQSGIEMMDHMIDLASQNQLYVMLTLDYHGGIKTKEDYWGGNAYWKKHPYNILNGGPCQNPADFFTNEKAKELYKNRLRFIMARWGYSPTIAVFEFWNELDNASYEENIPSEAVVAWHKEMSQYLSSIDPYNHLISTSLSHRPVPGLFDIPQIDFSQTHLYGHTPRMDTIISEYLNKYHKPTIVGEIGYDWKTPEKDKVELFKKDLKVSLWRGMFRETPVLPLTWWWEFFYENNGFSTFTHASNFLEKMMQNGKEGFKAVKASAGEGTEAKALQAGKTIYVWVNDSKSKNIELMIDSKVKKGPTIQLYNTSTGQLTNLDSKKVKTKSGKTTISLEEPNADFALILK